MAHKWARWLHNPCCLGCPVRFRAGGQNQKWPKSGQGGYITPAASGVPTASERGAESEGAHKWARWLHNPKRLGGPHRFRAGGRIRSGPQVGNGYITPAASGVPTASERGAESEVAQRWAHCLQACIVSKIGNSSFVVRSCNSLIFVANACRKKLSHRVIFFCGKSCNFVLRVNACNKKIVSSCNFFLR